MVDEQTQPDDEQAAPPQPRKITAPWSLRLNASQILLLAALGIGLLLISTFSQRITEGRALLDELERLEAELAELEAERIMLEETKAYYGSSAFVENWAHNEGKMIREGERLVIPIFTEPPTLAEAPTLAAPVLPSSDTFSPLQTWWLLFFDDAPPETITP
ncbi:MAG: hypothetical protein GYB68_06975 [Chloroflexi bacterium]|nr:hypothetical protein [Chloroflexota bacterium]